MNGRQYGIRVIYGIVILKSQLNMKSDFSRRKFILATTGAAALAALAGCGSPTAALLKRGSSASGGSVLALDLGGRNWMVVQKGKRDPISATVPGDIFTDLLAAGRIPDPNYRENNDLIQWVGLVPWVYYRDFTVTPELLSQPRVMLHCAGLDTLARIWINEAFIAQPENMFRDWIFDVREHLRAGKNSIRIEFSPCGNTVAAGANPEIDSGSKPCSDLVKKLWDAYRKEHGADLARDTFFGNQLGNPRSWIRKAPYMWGWDWCPAVVTCGIWKSIELLGYESRITDVGVFQDHSRHGRVKLTVRTSIDNPGKRVLDVVASVRLNGKAVTVGYGSVKADESVIELEIPNPQLWWPNGMGDHPLYAVQVDVRNSQGVILDSKERRTGLRQLEVLPPKDGTAMHLKINGVSFFAKGADCIPADNIPSRVTPEILRSYVEDAARCHFNMLRFWGGGYYEPQAQFDACDELGLLVQFEFKFANAPYPTLDDAWMNNVRAEVRQQVMDNRHHPCIVIWSGNNEVKFFNGYDHLFKDTIGGIIRELNPGAFYQVGSGAAGSGDIHTWKVWGGLEPFSNYQAVEGFVTEFGIQSFPTTQTIRAYTAPADRTSVNSSVMRYHELGESGHGIDYMMHYINDYFGKIPDDFDSTIWLSQIMQAMGIQTGVEHWRRNMPRSMASLIWQFNDCWPGPTWSMIDYCHRWKALMYASRRFFAPVLISPRVDAEAKQCDLFAVNDQMHNVSGQLRWGVGTLEGLTASSGELRIAVPARTSREVYRVDVAAAAAKYGAENLLVWAELAADGKKVSETMTAMARPKDLRLPDPHLTWTARKSLEGFVVRVKARKPALWTWLDLPGIDTGYSDNCVHLKPGSTTEWLVSPERDLSLRELHRQLRVRTVRDVCPAMRG